MEKTLIPGMEIELNKKKKTMKSVLIADTLLLWLTLITKQGSRGRGEIVRKIRVRLII